MIIPKEEDLQELEGTPKFVKASNWTSNKTPELTNKSSSSKIPDSGISSWNTLNIPENMPEINAIGLHEKEDNPWNLPKTGKLISLSETSDIGTLITKNIPLEGNTDRPLRKLYEGISNFNFRLNTENNPFYQPSESHVPVLPTFPTWESTDDVYYYNILKNKGSAKRKVTFGQTVTTPPFNLLSRKVPRYQTRYQTRSNNLSEESSDDDNNNNNHDQENNPPNRLSNQPPNQPLHHYLQTKIWITKTEAIIP